MVRKPNFYYRDVLFWMRELEWNGVYLNENIILLINQANDEIVVGLICMCLNYGYTKIVDVWEEILK